MDDRDPAHHDARHKDAQAQAPTPAGTGRTGELPDDSIPLLTEVVQFDASVPRIDGVDHELREALERRIVEQVLGRLVGSPELLGEPVHEAVRAATARFAETLALELQMTLEQTLRNALEPAVRDAVRDAVGASLPPGRPGPGPGRTL